MIFYAMAKILFLVEILHLYHYRRRSADTEDFSIITPNFIFSKGFVWCLRSENQGHDLSPPCGVTFTNLFRKIKQ
jgi:hypothetical protein